MIEEGVALSRFTTIGTGGPARALARPESVDELRRALAWAAERGLPVLAIGLGSNVLVADEGVEALVVKLSGALARVEVDGRSISRGRGREERRRACTRARGAGLGGFEFACAIPGTTGGGVWMNAGAYGGDFASVLGRALVVDADGAAWLGPDELGLAYRRSALEPGQVVARGRAPARAAVPSRRSARSSPSCRRSERPPSRRTSGRSAASSRTPSTS